jgi:hypothetical protein
MLHTRSLLLVLLSVMLMTSITLAKTPAGSKISKSAVNNLLEGIKSDNLGLKMSAAYFLGEYECSDAVIPLMRMLKSDDREEIRIAAALALYKINDDRGIFAVKQAIRFDDSERVKKICSNLYKEYCNPAKVDTILAVY